MYKNRQNRRKEAVVNYYISCKESDRTYTKSVLYILRFCFYFALIKANQMTKVVENYILFPVVYENSLMLKFEIPAPQFFSVVNMQFQNRELSKLTLAGPQ